MTTRVKAITLLGLALGLGACNEDHPFANGTPVGERCGSGPVEDFAGRAACGKGDTIETLKPADYCDFDYPVVSMSGGALGFSGSVASCVYVGELRKSREIGAEDARPLVSDSARAKADAEGKAAVAARARTEAEAKARAEAAAQAEAARPQAIDSIATTMVEVPAGSFQMGCSAGDSQCDSQEKPAHQVTIGPFRIGKYEVTQAQWEVVMGENPSHFKGPPDRPVENVSWNDVQ